MKAYRLFLAIALPEEIKEILQKSSIASEHKAVKWVKYDNLHITLLFLGDVQPEHLSDIYQRLDSMQKPQAFNLELDKVITVKRGRVPSMVWAAFKLNPQFAELAYNIATKLNTKPDKKPLAHVTLARIKYDTSVSINTHIFPEIAGIKVPVSSFGLWKSDLSPGGAKYSILKEWSLL